MEQPRQEKLVATRQFPQQTNLPSRDTAGNAMLPEVNHLDFGHVNLAETFDDLTDSNELGDLVRADD
jgi:hypothetical protein